MLPHQKNFIELALANQALQFGEFTLKSGRTSPYFFNAGRFESGGTLAQLGRCYAQTAETTGVSFDMLFGPAYKGIALSVATGIAYANHFGRDVPVAFNRKEAKTHGEAGCIIGAPLRGNVLLIDDVITAGTAIRESIALIRAQGARPSGVLVALDRQERGYEGLSATQEIAQNFDLPVFAIVTLADLLTFTQGNPGWTEHYGNILAYREQHGTRGKP